MDRSTVARGVSRLADRGYILTDSNAGRARRLAITDGGKDAIEQAVPLWRQAQDQLVEGLGTERWEQLLESLDFSVKAARNAT